MQRQKTQCKTIEKVLQAVDVPLVIGGCGDPVKDTAVFEEVCAQFPGERFLISSVTRDMDVEKCAKFIKKAGHAILSFTPMDLNLARELNRRLYDYVSKEDIVMDLTTAALGYGLDYAFTNMERARMGGLMGDTELAHPMSSGTTNAWAAREAWLKMGAEWEPRELRGPLWEVTTALTLLLAGVDLFMMMHPAAVKTLKDVTNYLIERQKSRPIKICKLGQSESLRSMTQMAEKKKGGLKELSPITIYKSLPKINCKECGVDNCMAFATKIVNREVELDSCKPLLKPENAKSYAVLKELLKPAVKEVIVGVGDKAKKIGGKLVMYRHEFTYKNPTAIAIDVTDEMTEQEIVSRVQKTDNFHLRIHR